MRVVQQIEQAGLPPGVAAAFRAGLAEVSAASGASPAERVLLEEVLTRLAPEGTAPAPFDELWPYADLFVLSAIWVAVSDGRYGVEEARVISALAHRLGLSAAALASLEQQVFAQIRARAQQLRDRAP